MPRQINDTEARDLGIETAHQVMDSGERRFRLISADGSSYIRTEALSGGGWQSSHYHRELSEFYAVQSGWLLYAELDPQGELQMKYMGPGDSILIPPLVHHNIYMSPFTVTHVIKFGAGSSRGDWIPSPVLDGLTRHLSSAELVGYMKE